MVVSRDQAEGSQLANTSAKKPDYHETDESADEGSPYVPRVMDEEDEELVVDSEDESHPRQVEKSAGKPKTTEKPRN